MDSPILTSEQRARLRPTVDVAALERLLAVLPAEARTAAVLACVAAPGFEEISALPGFPGGATSAPACAPGSGAPTPPPARAASLAIAYKNPEHQRLWEAVEPRAR
jgi:hypothetical protein